MQTCETKVELRDVLKKHHAANQMIVLVPTMGALHAGHQSLLEQARQMAGKDGVVVSSLFVNPIQFNNAGDLQTYPRTPEQDLEICQRAGVDYVFTPTPEEMYTGVRSISVEETYLSTTLCGASRPGHFAGVCTVLAKLFNIVQPTDAIFGKKDYQQLAIIRRLVRDLDIPVRIHGAEIVRHENGLAYSSRNARLTATQKEEATVLRQALLQAKNEFRAGVPVAEVKANASAMINKVAGTEIDYLEIVNAETMQPIEENADPALLATAVYFGDVRLIDNIEL
ncbi:MAG: pantoate--beta-alanine ligase [Akkermansia sp.]|nr:pantoate--beta-alanine ligase [Akkermansia sp.]